MTTSTTTQTWLKPGEIRRADLGFKLWDGTTEADVREVLILDTRPRDDGTTDVLWVSMSGLGRDRLPRSGARWSRLHNGETEQGAAMYLRLWEPTGTYKPRDPAYNSLEILRDQAIARVEREREHRQTHRPASVVEAAAAYREAQATERQAQVHLYDTIRDALAHGANALELARVTGLSAARIYQIRDGRR